MDLEELAINIAHKAHLGQVDKAGKPYIDHPMRVMTSLSDATHRLIGVLHDVIEDSGYVADDLLAEGMPQRVVDAVVALTHLPGEQRSEYYARIKTNADAVVVKLADIADNTNPERLAALPGATRNRLLRKYAEAMNALS